MFFAFVSIIALLSSTLAQSVNDTATFTVRGFKTLSAPSDQISVSLGIQNEAQSAYQAQVATNGVANRLISILQNYNVTDLSTDSMSLDADYNYTMTPPQIVGFISRTTVSFKTNAQMAGYTLDAAIRSGVNNIQTVTASVNDTMKDALYQQALSQAAQDAKQKALTVLRALGLCIGEPLALNIISNGGDFPTPMFSMESSAESTATSSSAAPTFLPGASQVSATVDAVFGYSAC